MKYFISLIVSLMLTLNPSFVSAGSHNSKPGKGPGTSSPSSQPDESAGNPQRQRGPEESGDKDRDRNQEHDKDCCDDNPGKGRERSEEMRERRDERKEEKAEYKSDRVPGQEGKSNNGASNKDGDKDVKKPWYEFEE